jgi:hypothetical protein
MLDKMMTYNSVWGEFLEWLVNKHSIHFKTVITQHSDKLSKCFFITHLFEDVPIKNYDLILSLTPIFLNDNHNIFVKIDKMFFGKDMLYDYILFFKDGSFIESDFQMNDIKKPLFPATYLEALKAGCIKAFEIAENKLKEL